MTERVSTFSEEAEKGLLGSVLLEPGRLLPVLLGKMALGAEELFVPAHQIVFETICAMQAQGRPIDVLTVAERLAAEGRTAAAGGPMFVDRLVDDTPTASHGEYYAQVVREKATLRRIQAVCREALARCEDGSGPAEVVSLAMGGLQAIGDETLKESRTNAEVFDSLMANWQRAKDMRQQGDDAYVPGLRTPYRRLNEIMGGMQPGLHFFGGKSSAGKTSLVLNITKQFLVDGHPGLMIQLDDTHEDVVGRLVSMMSSISLPALAQGFTSHEKLVMLKEEIRPAIAGMKLHVVEECGSVEEARSLARYYQARHGIKWMVIDYVQVLDAGGNPREDERMRLGKIAAACKRMWKELRIPVMVVSQTSKFKDSEDDGMKADMSDLFGASELFHAATSVMIAKAVREKNEERAFMPVQRAIDATGHTFEHAVAGHIVKNKHGARNCMVMFWMLPHYFRFTETRWMGSGTNARQMTWQEELAAGGVAEDGAEAARMDGF